MKEISYFFPRNNCGRVANRNHGGFNGVNTNSGEREISRARTSAGIKIETQTERRTVGEIEEKVVE